MRHKSFLLAIALLCCLPAFSQVGELRNNWAIGVHGGVNLNKVSFTSDVRVKEKMQVAPACGIMVRYLSEKYFAMLCALQVEVNYSQKGWLEDPDGNPYTYERKMHYLDVPFLVHLAYGKEERGVQVFLNPGPQVSFLVKEKEIYGGQWQDFPYEQHGKPADRSVDYGLTGGAGMEVRTGIGHFQIEGRYYFGLNDFYNNSKRDYFSRSAHSTISVRLAYLFDITK